MWQKLVRVLEFRIKQVTQKATIAHLSPMCQGQIWSFPNGLIWPKIELDRAFMPVLVTSNYDDDSIKNERASMETAFSHYKYMGSFLDSQGS